LSGADQAPAESGSECGDSEYRPSPTRFSSEQGGGEPQCDAANGGSGDPVRCVATTHELVGIDPVRIDFQTRDLEPTGRAAFEYAPRYEPLGQSAVGDTVPAHATAQAGCYDDTRRNVGPHERIAAESPAEYLPRFRGVRVEDPCGCSEPPIGPRACSASDPAASSRVCYADPQRAIDPVQADRDAHTPDHHARAASDQRGAPDDVQARYAIGSGEAPDCERPAEAPAETWRTWRLTRPSGFRTRSRTEPVCFLRDHRFGLRPPLTR